MFQFENNLLPDAFNDFSSLVSNNHNYNTRMVTQALHYIPAVNTYTYGTRSFKNICLNDWNNFKRHFPDHIKDT